MLKLIGMVAAVMVGVAMLAGCASSDKGGDGGDAGGLTVQALKGDWALTHIRGQAIHLPADARGPYLTFDPSGRISGQGGVNRVAGGYDKDGLADGRLMFTPLAMTMMAGPEPLMELEHRFSQTIDQVRRARIEDQTLIMTDQAGAELLRFRRSGG